MLLSFSQQYPSVSVLQVLLQVKIQYKNVSFKRLLEGGLMGHWSKITQLVPTSCCLFLPFHRTPIVKKQYRQKTITQKMVLPPSSKGHTHATMEKFFYSI